MRIEKRRKAIIIVIFLIIFVLFLFFINRPREERKTVIRVDGWDLEYTASDRVLTVEDFDSIELGVSLDEIEDKLGKPDGWIGEDILVPVYILQDGIAVELVFKGNKTYEELEDIFFYKSMLKR